VGPEGEFAAASDQSPASGLDRPAGALEEAGAGRGLWRRHPGRVDGPPRAKVLGIDLSAKPLKVAQLHALEAGVDNLSYREVAVEDLATEAGQLRRGDLHGDAGACAGSGLGRPRLCPAWSTGGWVFFSTINRNPKAFLFAIVGAEHVLKLLPKGTHEYARFIKPSELSTHIRSAGLSVEGFKGMEYNPLSKRYWLSADTSVNYLVACRKSA
jgi:2-polyprenyl-6-hydroxyphenyl methylase/3-demethylubiquinone-9 3-methyltransferase